MHKLSGKIKNVAPATNEINQRNKPTDANSSISVSVVGKCTQHKPVEKRHTHTKKLSSCPEWSEKRS